VLQNEITNLQSDLQELTLRLNTTNRALEIAEEKHASVSAAAAAVDPEVQEKLNYAEMRVALLEEQQAEHTRDTQKEISALKIKLMEFEHDDVEALLGGMELGGMSGSSSLSSLATALKPT
jgi:chromosome segregation ATPase